MFNGSDQMWYAVTIRKLLAVELLVALLVTLWALHADSPPALAGALVTVAWVVAVWSCAHVQKINQALGIPV